MEHREYTTIDKAKWLRGPWDAEPDKVQFEDPATGMPCLLVRHSGAGHWCGYVGVAEGHPMFDENYGDYDFGDVHGGITFASFCQESDDESKGVCHIPGPGESDHVYWFGFDAAHSGDLCPITTSLVGERLSIKEEYRDREYMQGECARLALELTAMAKSGRKPPKWSWCDD